MRNLWLGTVLATLVGALPAAAQETPKVEVSANYGFIHTRLVPSGGCCFNMHGGSFSIAANLNRTVSLVGDFGAYRTNNVKSSGFNLHVVTYMFGPRFNIRRHESLTLFGQALFGGGYAGGSFIPVDRRSARRTPSQWRSAAGSTSSCTNTWPCGWFRPSGFSPSSPTASTIARTTFVSRVVSSSASAPCSKALYTAAFSWRP